MAAHCYGVSENQARLESLVQKLNLSFSPSFSLGLGRLGIVLNRFNGLGRSTEAFGNR